MLKNVFAEIFERDLHKLIIELNSYENENNIWIIEGNIKNSAGNLCLHLIGNLKHFIGGILGGFEYVRNRDAEFSSTGISRKDIIKSIEETSGLVLGTLENMKEEEFAVEYPYEVFNRKMTNTHFLIHLSTHLNYHLGQINYHRRLIAN